MVLECIRKQAEKGLKGKPVSSTPPWPLLQFQPPGSGPDFSASWTAAYKILLKLLLVMVFIRAIETKAGQPLNDTEGSIIKHRGIPE